MDKSAADEDLHIPEYWDDWSSEMRVIYLEEDNLFSEPIEGVAELSRASVVELARTEDIPADWDADEAVRTAFIEAQINATETEREEVVVLEEEESKNILGFAQRIPQTIAFTLLAFTQMFEVMAIHAGDRVSFFKKWFGANMLLMWAVISTFVLQLIVIYLPFGQDVFRTAPLSLGELILTAIGGSVILFAVELEKMYITRHSR
jgi:hypothetical protein